MTERVAIAAGAGLIAFFATHILVWRASPSNSPRMATLAMLSAFGIAVGLATTMYFFGPAPLPLALVLWMEVAAIIAYVFVYAGVARSVSVTLLGRLLDGRPRAIAFESFEKEYSGSTRFEDRLQLMHHSGLVELQGNTVRLTAKGRRLAHATQSVSRAIGTRMEG